MKMNESERIWMKVIDLLYKRMYHKEKEVV